MVKFPKLPYVDDSYFMQYCFDYIVAPRVEVYENCGMHLNAETICNSAVLLLLPVSVTDKNEKAFKIRFLPYTIPAFTWRQHAYSSYVCILCFIHVWT